MRLNFTDRESANCKKMLGSPNPIPAKELRLKFRPRRRKFAMLEASHHVRDGQFRKSSRLANNMNVTINAGVSYFHLHRTHFHGDGTSRSALFCLHGCGMLFLVTYFLISFFGPLQANYTEGPTRTCRTRIKKLNLLGGVTGHN